MEKKSQLMSVDLFAFVLNSALLNLQWIRQNGFFTNNLMSIWQVNTSYSESVWPESLGPKTPKGNLKTPKKNTTLKTRKHHVFGYKNTKYLIKSFKNGPPKHFYCIFLYQFLKNFNFFTEIFQKISIFF